MYLVQEDIYIYTTMKAKQSSPFYQVGGAQGRHENQPTRGAEDRGGA